MKILDEQDRESKKRWLKVTVLAPPPEAKPEEKPKPTTPMIAVLNPPPADNNAGSEIPMWVNADQVNEVRVLARPATVPADIDRWVDVDLGEQVLVLYEADKPVFATLVSSGRAIPTPMGTYPVWAKVAAITMKNQPYEDKGYFVNKVPWSTFFQWHNAIHGAYWHDRFGVSKSHGCVNVAPLDARHVFEWVSPPLAARMVGPCVPRICSSRRMSSCATHTRRNSSVRTVPSVRPIASSKDNASKKPRSVAPKKRR